MLILHYLIFKTNYVVRNLTCGMLWYVTIFTSSSYVSIMGLNEKNKPTLYSQCRHMFTV